MLSILGFLIILGPLVIVHEFGHYIFARIFGVKAEVFSVGFGPVLWKRQLGETELRLSAIPLGGFVKLLGEERDQPLPPEIQHRALGRQAPWKRFFIFLGGSLFNFLFAIVIFMAILAIGEPQVASVVGRVVDQSPAYQAGFRSGDKIVAVKGAPVTKFEEVLLAVNEHPSGPMEFKVVRATGEQTIQITPTEQSGFSVYGEKTNVGEIKGMLAIPRGMAIGVSDLNSFAGKAGLRTGDLIVEMNGAKAASWEEIESKYSQIPDGSDVSFKIKKAGSDQSVDVSFKKSGDSMRSAWGLDSSELFIDKVVPESPAQTTGLRQGDRLVGVGDHVVHSFFDLRDEVQRAGEKHGKVFLKWEREGKPMQAEIVPTATSGRDPILNKTTQYTVGVIPVVSLGEPVTVLERVLNPFTLLYKGTERMVVFTYRNFVSIGKMFTGDVSVATLGGPILIGKIAGDSLSRGLIAVLTTMAVLSVGLGVLNILPIPVLDGGHILLLGVEAIRRKPLTMRQMEVIQMGGLSLILLLMVVVIKNDLTRLPFFN